MIFSIIYYNIVDHESHRPSIVMNNTWIISVALLHNNLPLQVFLTEHDTRSRNAVDSIPLLSVYIFDISIIMMVIFK